ncbi:MAG: tetratricopeptide repeat protein, partial [Phycisphaerae bacterium]
SADSPVAPGVIRAELIALAQRLQREGRPGLGLEHLRLARSTLDSADGEQQAVYEEMLANLSLALAERFSEGGAEASNPAGDTAPDLERARALFREAGDALLRVATLRTLDANASGNALWRAISAYDSGGQFAQTADLLVAFIDERPNDSRRVAALFRLGRLWQSARTYATAVGVYEQLLREYPRTPDALRALVPLAQCLITLGGDGVRRGERLLLNVLDESAETDPLFDPTAPEYADGLMALSELYYEEKRFEDAIFRLETFANLYPADARERSARFLLGDAYRLSGRRLLADRGDAATADERERLTDEAFRRIARAAGLFERVISEHSDAVDVGAFDRVRHQSAWLYRGDCLFDLGRYDEARRVYSEAAWRFGNEWTAVAAMMQVAHCYRRMKRSEDARAALTRLQVLLERLPDSAFEERSALPDKAYWKRAVKDMLVSSVN